MARTSRAVPGRRSGLGIGRRHSRSRHSGYLAKPSQGRQALTLPGHLVGRGARISQCPPGPDSPRPSQARRPGGLLPGNRAQGAIGKAQGRGAGRDSALSRYVPCPRHSPHAPLKCVYLVIWRMHRDQPGGEGVDTPTGSGCPHYPFSAPVEPFQARSEGTYGQGGKGG